jgi:hypothetical protein
MSLVEAALAEARGSESLNLSALATKYGIDRSNLSRRYNGTTSSRTSSTENRRVLNNQQEQVLLGFITEQCERCLPPTSALVSALASELANKQVSTNWCSRFVARHKLLLDSRYVHNMDLSRHKADSEASFKQYFSVIGAKIEEYNLTPENIYNMDEKGFMLGACQKGRRILCRETYKDKKLVTAGHDGSRQWVTIIATICADGTAVQPAIIYKSGSGNIMESWLEDFNLDDDEASFSCSANGWTSDKHGLDWLNTIFEPHTVQKARRRWRLLFLDGHGSHLNMSFVKRAYELRILLAIYPPHATHRLQPLDVSLFNPLANYYSQAVNNLVSRTRGSSALKKPDFFPLFREAYHKAFTRKNIESGWRKTGIWPPNPQIVLDQLPTKAKPIERRTLARTHGSSSPPDQYSTPRKRKRFQKHIATSAAQMDDKSGYLLTKVYNRLESVAAQVATLTRDLAGATESLSRHQKQKTRRKTIFEQARSDTGCGTLFIDGPQIAEFKKTAEAREAEKELLELAKLANKEAAIHRKAEREAAVAQRKVECAVAAADRRAIVEARKLAGKAEKLEIQKAKDAQLELKAIMKARRVKPARKLATAKSKPKPALPAPPEPDIRVQTRSGRAAHKPRRYRAPI